MSTQCRHSRVSPQVPSDQPMGSLEMAFPQEPRCWREAALATHLPGTSWREAELPGWEAFATEAHGSTAAQRPLKPHPSTFRMGKLRQGGLEITKDVSTASSVTISDWKSS